MEYPDPGSPDCGVKILKWAKRHVEQLRKWSVEKGDESKLEEGDSILF